MWIEEWRAISARISGLLGAASFFLETKENDVWSLDTELITNCRRVAELIFAFRENHQISLPRPALQCVNRFLDRYDSLFHIYPTTAVSPQPNGFGGVTTAVTTLELFRVEFEHLIIDADENAKSLSVRAFLNIQRGIVADEQERDRWIKAFGKNERACEMLGAVHLLRYGIWAFKTSATGEQTDLVYDEPRPMDADVRRASLGLVLTEWKIVREAAQLEAQANAAYEQASRYKAGILADIHVAAARYLVIVSKDHMLMPSARIEGNAIFEYRNIAVDPKPPSRSHR